jgi:uncharacterized membrane protein affecting hemolysin expression
MTAFGVLTSVMILLYLLIQFSPLAFITFVGGGILLCTTTFYILEQQQTVAFSCQYMAHHHGANVEQLMELCERYGYKQFPVKHFITSGEQLEHYMTQFIEEESQFILDKATYQQHKDVYARASEKTNQRRHFGW